VGEQAERAAPLDDGEHLEPAARGGEPGDRGVAGLVGGDEPLLVRGVADRLAGADLLDQAGLLDVLPAHRALPRRTALTSASSSRCSIITGV
jgi:hypothetical protein